MNNQQINSLSLYNKQAQLVGQEHQLNQLGKKRAGSDKAVREAATEFAAVQWSQILKSMFEGVSADPLTKDDNASKIYRSMQLDEVARAIAQKGGKVSLTEDVHKALLRAQEFSSNNRFGDETIE